jgi:putative acetyltransferase
MIEIKPIQQHQFEEAKRSVTAVNLDFWQGDLTEDDLRRMDLMSDIEYAQSHYFDNRGLFLVLLDDGKIVGTGAIRRLDDETCELKRMWFHRQYRGQGWGWKMAQMLLDFARQTGYQKVRLDLAKAERQLQAMKFYTKLGFYPIDRYNDAPCEVFMEKCL